jgi:polysaccharide biosynthesis/export protein
MLGGIVSNTKEQMDNLMRLSQILRMMFVMFGVALLMPVSSVSAQSTTIRDMYRQRAEEEQARPTVGSSRRQQSERTETIPQNASKVPSGDAIPQDRVIDRTVYRLGPGDVLAFELTGNVYRIEMVPVTPEGRVMIPSLGAVDVAGLTVAQAEERVTEVALDTYGGVRISLSILSLRTFRVHVVGRVVEPGTYTATAMDRVSDIVLRAGGLVDDDASTRRINLRRNNGTSSTVDLAYFHSTGNTDQNPSLEMGDVIRVPGAVDKVAVWGSVDSPGEFEYRRDDTIKRLIRIAGGRTHPGLSAQIEWAPSPSGDSSNEIRKMDLDAALREPYNSSIRAGDQITVLDQEEARIADRAEIRGEVSMPGFYSLAPGGTRISELVRRAGGLLPEASADASYVVREGQVNSPEGQANSLDSEYKRLFDMSLDEMGRTERAYFVARSRQIRWKASGDVGAALREPGEQADAVLYDGDVLYIYRASVSVETLGQVEKPGLHAFEPGHTVDYYIDAAGGTSWNAHKSGIRLIRYDSQVWLKPDMNTVVEAGDTIFVPERAEGANWLLTKDLVAMTAQIMTIVLLFVTIR